MSRRATPSPRPPFRVLPALALLAACASPPPPLALPVAELLVSYRHAAGIASDHPLAEQFASSRVVQLRAIAKTPDGTAVEAAAQSIANDQGTPFRGRSQLPIGTVLLSHDQVQSMFGAGQASVSNPAEVQQLGAVEVLISSDWTSRVHPESGVIESALDGTIPFPDLLLRDVAGNLQLALRMPAADDQPEETLTLSASPAPAQTAGLFVPDQRTANGSGGLLLLIEPATPPSTAALAVAESAVQASQTQPTDQQLPAAWQLIRDAVGERNRRPALLALAQPMGLDRVVDTILAADEATLIQISKRLVQIDPHGDGVPWRTERATWRALIQQIERGELPASLHAAAERHLGAIADDPGTLHVLLQTSGDGDTFCHNLCEENLAALTDRKSSVRVAAQTWLARRGITVPDYDPQADRATLRKTVRQFLTDREREQNASQQQDNGQTTTGSRRQAR